MVATRDECNVAGLQLGYPFKKEVADADNRPAGCFWDQDESSYFSSRGRGRGRRGRTEDSMELGRRQGQLPVTTGGLGENVNNSHSTFGGACPTKSPTTTGAMGAKE